MGTLKIITGPTKEPVTLTEAKRSLGITEDDDDSRIAGYIKSGRVFAEAFCGIKIMTQTVELSFDNWPSYEITLGVWPLQSIDSVKYDDTASPSAEQTLVANTDYYADTTTIEGRIRTLTGWPSVAVKPNPIRIRMTAGYATAELVPSNIKDAIMAYCGYLYELDPEMKDIAEDLLWSEKVI